MEGTRSRFIVTLTIALLLSMNLLAVGIMAQMEGNLEIVVDSVSKEVSPGEDAVFHWTAYNNDTFTAYDLSVSSPGTEFSESSFSLQPGESHSVTQTVTTSVDDENNTQYNYQVTWTGEWQRGISSGSITPIEGTISVTVITPDDNQNGDGDDTPGNGDNGDGGDDTENGDDDGNGDKGSTSGFEPIFLIVAILITLIILRKKRMNSQA